jgi:hypothetical protein
MLLEVKNAILTQNSGNKNIASGSAKVSERENDNFLFSSQQKECFLKK